MVRTLILGLIFLLLPALASAQQTQFGAGVGDVCEALPHAVIPLTFSAATALTQQIALAAGKSIYVCSMVVVTAATSTFQVESGTGTNCASNTTALSGVYIASSVVVTPANTTIMSTLPGYELCVVTTGATGQANGWLSYVQY